MITYDKYLDACGAILHEQTDVTTEAMRVLGAKNWVGFIERARDEMTPKVKKFCDQRDAFLAQPLPEHLHRTDKFDTDFDGTVEKLRQINFD